MEGHLGVPRRPCPRQLVHYHPTFAGPLPVGGDCSSVVECAVVSYPVQRTAAVAAVAAVLAGPAVAAAVVAFGQLEGEFVPVVAAVVVDGAASN